jgi:hypothetical protein
MAVLQTWVLGIKRCRCGDAFATACGSKEDVFILVLNQ